MGGRATFRQQRGYVLSVFAHFVTLCSHFWGVVFFAFDVEDLTGRRVNFQFNFHVSGDIPSFCFQNTVFKLQLDPYEQSLRHVGTHVLATELSRDAIQEGLVKGRAFVAFERALELAVEEGGARGTERIPEARWRMAACLRSLGKLGMTEHELRAGDRIVLYSDGVAEEPDSTGEQFGVERTQTALRGSVTVAEDVERVMNALREFAGGEAYSDDVTVASLEITAIG